MRCSNWLLVGGLVPLVAACSLRSPNQSAAALTIAEVIGWLPTNTETLIVANGPIDPDSGPQGPGDPARALEFIALGPLLGYRDGDAFRELSGSSIRFAVEGARNFRAPNGFGLGPYDGCHILVMADSSGAAIARVIDRLTASGGTAMRISGHDAIRLDWRAERDDWSAFVVRARPNVLIVATNEAMLAEALQRSRGGSTGRALAAHLPEWSGVDTTARVWAIRHYSTEGNRDDPTSPLTPTRRAANRPDTMAVGLTVHVAAGAPQVVIAHYYSRNPQARDVARWMWEQSGDGMNSTFTQGPAGAVRIAAAPTTHSGWSNLLLVVLGTLGHAIYL